MNILFLMGVYPNYGGVEKVSTILANEFVKRGYGVSIVSFEQPHPELAEQELDKNVKLYKLKYPVRSGRNVKTLRHILETEHVNVIINQWVVPFYVAHLCRKAMKGTDCKLICVHHNLPNTNARIKDIEIRLDNNKGSKLLNKILLFAVKAVSRLSLRYTFSKCDKYVVLSPSFIPILQNYISVSKDSSKIISIANPVTIEGLEKVDFDRKKKEILYVGRIEYNQKRTFRLVEIWKELSSKHSDWKLTIVGDGPDTADLKGRIKESGVKNIDMVGFKNPKDFYCRASILLLVSEYEGFPLVIAEAMNNGCVPVVLDSFAAVHDIIKKGTGLIIPYPYDKMTVVKMMDDLMSESETLRRMSEEALAYSQNFKLDNICAEWEKLFKTI